MIRDEDMFKNRYYYPAIFTVSEINISVEFPDLPGCLPCGNDVEKAIENAKEAMGFFLCELEQDGKKIPTPTKVTDLKTESNQFIFLVEAWMPLYRNKCKNLSVKKTVTIPNWLNELAIESNVNFSAVFQKALKEHLGCSETELNGLKVKQSNTVKEMQPKSEHPNDLLYLTTIWDKVLEIIKPYLSAPSYASWLEPIKLTSIDSENKILFVETPSDFAKEWLEARYEPMLTKAIDEVLDGLYSIEFYVNH